MSEVPKLKKKSASFSVRRKGKGRSELRSAARLQKDRPQIFERRGKRKRGEKCIDHYPTCSRKRVGK